MHAAQKLNAKRTEKAVARAKREGARKANSGKAHTRALSKRALLALVAKQVRELRNKPDTLTKPKLF